MTVIAWDGETLAADRNMHDGNDAFVGVRNKLLRIDDDRIAGGAGTQAVITLLAIWLRDGANADAFPAEAREEKHNSTLMVVHRDGTVYLYSDMPHPSILDPQKHAIGSGCVEARVAMYCGKDAAEAVRVASVWDAHCGGGVDTLSFEEEPAHATEQDRLASIADVGEWAREQVELLRAKLP